MSEQITVVVYANTGYANSDRKEEIKIDKSDYDAAEDKEEFLQKIYDEVIGDLVESGVYIKGE